MKKPEERRRYCRVEVPIAVRIITGDSRITLTETKDISALGLRFELPSALGKDEEIEIILGIPAAPNPVHARGKVAWQKKISLENGVPYDVGCAFTEIEEDNKNTFLKYFCNLLYEQAGSLKTK